MRSLYRSSSITHDVFLFHTANLHFFLHIMLIILFTTLCKTDDIATTLSTYCVVFKNKVIICSDSTLILPPYCDRILLTYDYRIVKADNAEDNTATLCCLCCHKWVNILLQCGNNMVNSMIKIL